MSTPRATMPSEAAQGYLLTLRSMTALGGTAMTASLGRRMGVSVQAASEMVGRLAADGLVEMDAERSLRLTEAGRAVADTIFRRHSLLEWLLTRVVGLGWAESDEEAARLQGALSPRVEDAIAELMGHPPTCPHGNPIDQQAQLTRPAGIPLADARPGIVTILRITEEAEEDAGLLIHLEQQGLVPGAHASVVEVSASRDDVTLDGPKGRTALGLRSAGLIRVLPGNADPGLFHVVPARIGAIRSTSL